MQEAVSATPTRASAVKTAFSLLQRHFVLSPLYEINKNSVFLQLGCLSSTMWVVGTKFITQDLRDDVSKNSQVEEPICGWYFGLDVVWAHQR